MNGEKHKAQAFKDQKKQQQGERNYSYYSCVKQIQWYRVPINI